jgi:putative holliday junction resolvase
LRVLGVDVGGRRTGLALSDPLGITCSPLEVVEERRVEALVARVAEAVHEHGVGEIVVGVPRPLKGGTNQQVEAVMSVVAELSKTLDVPVHTWDERFTSKLAERGRRDRDRKQPADAVAACYFLQDYLDARSQTSQTDMSLRGMEKSGGRPAGQ